MAETELIILDTDIGSDIGDVMCLAYLLAQPRCELIGITSVGGQVQRRAMLADAMCRAAGRADIPVYAGTANGILLPTPQTECPQAEILETWAHRERFNPGDAVEFMRTQIRRRPGEVTLLAIGPLTNVGLLLTLDPEIAQLLRRLVVMGGIFQGGGPGGREWNALCDPHATAIVYQSSAPMHRSVGLDVTRQCTLSTADFWERFPASEQPIATEAAKVWFRNRSRITFHDPLAAATIFEPDLCGYAQGFVDVELASKHSLGATYWRKEDNGPHEVAVRVDAERFFDHYFSVVTSGDMQVGSVKG